MPFSLLPDKNSDIHLCCSAESVLVSGDREREIEEGEGMCIDKEYFVRLLHVSPDIAKAFSVPKPDKYSKNVIFPAHALTDHAHA